MLPQQQRYMVLQVFCDLHHIAHWSSARPNQNGVQSTIPPIR